MHAEFNLEAWPSPRLPTGAERLGSNIVQAQEPSERAHSGHVSVGSSSLRRAGMVARLTRMLPVALAATAVFLLTDLVQAGDTFGDKVFDDKPAAESQASDPLAATKPSSKPTSSSQPSSSQPSSSPWDVFKLGFTAYKSGHKEQALEAYRYAAENGQIGATWKLARMYAEGDGVGENDLEAFKFYSEIVDQDIEPGSPDESYISDALVALGDYMMHGIPNTGINPDREAAQEYYMRAAANYRNPEAQFELGKMFLKGEGGIKPSVAQAGRWLQLAAEKGHAGAQATLGNLLFQSGKVVRGLAMMTVALEHAKPTDRGWIQGMQEDAFSVTTEKERRTAMTLSETILDDLNR